MKRKLLALLAVGALALSLAGPVSASPAPPAPAANVTLDEFGPCVDATPNAEQGGMLTYSLYAFNGVEAEIDPLTTTFGPCSGTTLPSNGDGAFAWVAIQAPADYVAPGYNGKGIVQIGVSRCNKLFEGACLPERVQVVWAYGGCWASAPGPRLVSGIDHPAAPHTYTVRYGSVAVVLSVDGVEVARVDRDDPGIGCWINGPRKTAVVAAERWDGGDSLADADNKLKFKHIRLRTAGETWYSAQYDPTEGCDIPMPDSSVLNYRCAVTAPDKILMWSERK